MSFAEIILRIGVALGGWLIFIGNMLLVGVVRYADCEPGNDEMWRGTLFFGVLSGAAVAASTLGIAWRKELKFLAGVGALLILYALPVIGSGLLSTTIGGESLCHIAGQTQQSVDVSALGPTLVERAWPPVQLLVGLIGAIQTRRFFRADPEDSTS